MNHQRERFVVGGEKTSINAEKFTVHATDPKASFNLEIVKDAFAACSVYPSDRRQDYSDTSSEDEFEDALSDIEDTDGKSEAIATSPKRKPRHNEDFVDALEYTKGFNEIAQFFKFLNIAFAFVGKNVESSCEYITTVAKILATDQDTPVSLEQTLEYDEQHDHKYGIISCVLWLHRPMELIIMLFRDLANSNEEDLTSELAKRCYLATLGRHHAWAIQQMVNVLLMTLPQKEQVFQMMNFADNDEAKRLLLQVSENGKLPFERVEQMVQRLGLNDKC